MDELIVKVNGNDYPIYIGEGLYNNIRDYIKKDYSRILIITDNNVANLYLNEVEQSLDSNNVYTHIISSGEQSKSVTEFYNIHTKLIESGFDRDSLIIALGGGVIGDLAGFSASTYMRGIDYIQVPTTILAHDSSVGGKVAINHKLGKNMIGQFYHPKMVLYDVSVFKSLPQKEIRSGYAELIKEALISDGDFFNNLLNRNLSTLDLTAMRQDIKNGISIKKEIVQKDEKENGVRKYLNLGHTLGHALETYNNYKHITHGEAVAIGLLFAIYVSELDIKKSLLFHVLHDWFKFNDYPLNFNDLDVKRIVELMKSDKKAKKQIVQMILLEDVGSPYINSINDNEISSYMNSFFKEMGMV